MPKLKKGESAPLNITDTSRRRVFAGLGWAPNEKTGLLDKAKAMAGGRSTNHDLDLSCYIYDINRAFIGCVCAKDGMHIDQTGKVYHSGDNVQGLGGGDDEQISVELKGLDPVIHSVLFMASIESGHFFHEVNDAHIRVGDGYSEHIFLEHSLNSSVSNEKNAYVFARINKDVEDTWHLSYIDEYFTLSDEQDLAAALKQYL